MSKVILNKILINFYYQKLNFFEKHFWTKLCVPKSVSSIDGKKILFETQ